MTIHYRKFIPDDRLPAYRVFRDAIWQYLLELSIITADEQDDFDKHYAEHEPLYLHLEQTAFQDWVATDDGGNLLGWARSIERDNHLQLTHFFVGSKQQGSGIGRGLLDRVFPLNHGEQRSVIATTNPLALSLYQRYNVGFRGMAFSIYGQPTRRPFISDLDVEVLDDTAASLRLISQLDREIMGYDRSIDLAFFLREQPAYVFRRDGIAVAYLFGCNGNSAGPGATLDPDDLPVLMQQLEASACDVELEELWLSIPAMAQQAVSWALNSGYKIDPFHEVLFAQQPTMKLDRYIMTQSSFTW